FLSFFFSFHAPAPTDLYTLSLHDALPISAPVARAVLHPTRPRRRARLLRRRRSGTRRRRPGRASDPHPRRRPRRRESQRGGARGSSAGAERGRWARTFRTIPAPDSFRTRRAAAGRGASTRSRNLVGWGTRTRWPGGRGQGSGRGTLPVGELAVPQEHACQVAGRYLRLSTRRSPSVHEVVVSRYSAAASGTTAAMTAVMKGR